MKRYQTQNLKIKIDLEETTVNKAKIIRVSFGDDEKNIIENIVSKSVCKSCFNDGAFVKHIFNFFTKD